MFEGKIYTEISNDNIQNITLQNEQLHEITMYNKYRIQQ